MICRSALLFLGMFLLRPTVGVARAEASAEQIEFFETKIRPIFAENCYQCHSAKAEKVKGGLRVDAPEELLKGSGSGPALVPGDPEASLLIKAVRYNDPELQMPPKNKTPRPDEKDQQAVLAGLRERLHAASLDRQRHEGRVAIRRLNRTEYETTLRDLLAAPVEVKDLLPEDNVSAGFDNVGAVLDVSPTHLLRYQEAAEKAVRSVIPNRPKASMKVRYTAARFTPANAAPSAPRGSWSAPVNPV